MIFDARARVLRTLPWLLALLLAFVAVTSTAHAKGEPVRFSPWKGGATPALVLKDGRGKEHDLAAYRGKLVLVNFWATWCGPCRTELPLFEKTIEKYKGNSDVAFIAVTTDEDRDLVAPFVKQSKYNLPVAFAENIDQFYAITAIPTTVVLDRKGRVSFRMRGFNPKDDFVAFLGEKIEMALKAE